MTKKDKAIQELCDSLGGDYKVQDIDLETCIYRDFGNGFDVEISGVYTTSQKKKATIYLWCVGEGHYFQIVRIANGVARDEIGKVVEELFAYSEELIAQGYDSYKKFWLFKTAARKERAWCDCRMK